MRDSIKCNDCKLDFTEIISISVQVEFGPLRYFGFWCVDCFSALYLINNLTKIINPFAYPRCSKCRLSITHDEYRVSYNSIKNRKPRNEILLYYCKSCYVKEIDYNTV